MNIKYKKLWSATNILGDFCHVQFCYWTFGCTNKSQNWKWHRRNSAGAMIKLPRHVYSPNNKASVSNDGKMPGFRKFLFLSSVIKFDSKWAKSKQRSQSPKLLRLTPGLTIVSAKSTIYSPRQGYLSPGNSIILEIAVLYYSSASQFFADFGAHFVETQARFQQTCLFSWTFSAYKAILKISSCITFQP